MPGGVIFMKTLRGNAEQGLFLEDGMLDKYKELRETLRERFSGS